MLLVVFLFFKQKTAYEMLRRLVGSEMCIRDRGSQTQAGEDACRDKPAGLAGEDAEHEHRKARVEDCLLYTSDAADDLLCVDLGGRRNIKKKNNNNK